MEYRANMLGNLMVAMFYYMCWPIWVHMSELFGIASTISLGN